jgi:hypothetical protein
MFDDAFADDMYAVKSSFRQVCNTSHSSVDHLNWELFLNCRQLSLLKSPRLSPLPNPDYRGCETRCVLCLLPTAVAATPM